MMEDPESSDGQERPSSEEMADDIVDAVESDSQDEDALSKQEREVEEDKEAERIRKARELRKQLRKRELGILRYRWPAAILIISGLMSIWTQFLQVMVHPPEVGFDTFMAAAIETGNLFFLFPTIAGAILIICGIFAYTDPRWTFVSIIPAMMMAMSGATVYFLVTFAVTVDPDLVGQVYATGTAFSMLIIAVIALLAIAMKEKE